MPFERSGGSLLACLRLLLDRFVLRDNETAVAEFTAVAGPWGDGSGL